MAAEEKNGPDLSPEVRELIRVTHLQHPFWSFEKLAEHVRAAGHPVSAFAVSWVHGEDSQP